jgi:hypothetical protein
MFPASNGSSHLAGHETNIRPRFHLAIFPLRLNRSDGLVEDS